RAPRSAPWSRSAAASASITPKSGGMLRCASMMRTAKLSRNSADASEGANLNRRQQRERRSSQLISPFPPLPPVRIPRKTGDPAMRWTLAPILILSLTALAEPPATTEEIARMIADHQYAPALQRIAASLAL